MDKRDTLLLILPQTNFEEVEFVRKEALLDWIETKIFSEQGYASGEAEYGYKDALKDMKNYLNEDGYLNKYES